MCSHYEGVREREKFLKQFRVIAPEHLGRHDVWPGYEAAFIRKHEFAEVGDDAVPENELMVGRFGMIPGWWKKPDELPSKTYNARNETVAEKASYRDAWKKAKHCIIPADAIYEPFYYEQKKSRPVRITRADERPMGIAGLWTTWHSPTGPVLSFTMLTVNADTHPFMSRFHEWEEEKRMVVILPGQSENRDLTSFGENTRSKCFPPIRRGESANVESESRRHTQSQTRRLALQGLRPH